MVLIYIFSLTSDIEHLFMYLWAICISSLLQYLFKFFSYILGGCLTVLRVLYAYKFFVRYIYYILGIFFLSALFLNFLLIAFQWAVVLNFD